MAACHPAIEILACIFARIGRRPEKLAMMLVELLRERDHALPVSRPGAAQARLPGRPVTLPLRPRDTPTHCVIALVTDNACIDKARFLAESHPRCESNHALVTTPGAHADAGEIEGAQLVVEPEREGLTPVALARCIFGSDHDPAITPLRFLLNPIASDPANVATRLGLDFKTCAPSGGWLAQAFFEFSGGETRLAPSVLPGSIPGLPGLIRSRPCADILQILSAWIPQIHLIAMQNHGRPPPSVECARNSCMRPLLHGRGFPKSLCCGSLSDKSFDFGMGPEDAAARICWGMGAMTHGERSQT